MICNALRIVPILALLFLPAISSLAGEVYLAEKITYAWNNDSWNEQLSTRMAYNAEGLRSAEVTLAMEDGIWQEINRSLLHYNDERLLVEKQVQTAVSGIWVRRTKTMYLYDDNGFRTHEHGEEAGVDGFYHNFYTSDYHRNAQGKPEEQTVQRWKKSGWQDDCRYRRVYDDAGKLVEEIQESFSGKSWQLSARLGYRYNANGDIQEAVLYSPQGAGWKPVRRELYTYDAGHFPAVRLRQGFSNGSWENRGRSIYNYTEGRLQDLTIQVWRKDGWLNHRKIENIYHEKTTTVGAAPGSPDISLRVQPNPFASTSEILYSLSAGAETEIQVLDISGRVLVTLVSKPHEAGEFRLHFDRGELAAGVYYCRMRAGETILAEEMVISN